MVATGGGGGEKNSWYHRFFLPPPPRGGTARKKIPSLCVKKFRNPNFLLKNTLVAFSYCVSVAYIML